MPVSTVVVACIHLKDIGKTFTVVLRPDTVVTHVDLAFPCPVRSLAKSLAKRDVDVVVSITENVMENAMANIMENINKI